MVELAEDVRVIDADTHLTEQPDLWTKRAPAAYRDRVLHVEEIDGSPTWVVDGVQLGFVRGGGVIDRDEEIDAAFLSIMRQLISYMMEDPRTITPALEIVFIAKSLERIGDHAKNIAEAVVQVVRGIDVRHATAEQIRAEVGE